MAALIQREFGVRYHPEYIPRLLRSFGWTPQQPVTHASQQDEAKIAQFKTEWAEVKKGRASKAAPLSG